MATENNYHASLWTDTGIPAYSGRTQLWSVFPWAAFLPPEDPEYSPGLKSPIVLIESLPGYSVFLTDRSNMWPGISRRLPDHLKLNLSGVFPVKKIPQIVSCVLCLFFQKWKRDKIREDSLYITWSLDNGLSASSAPAVRWYPEDRTLSSSLRNYRSPAGKN